MHHSVVFVVLEVMASVTGGQTQPESGEEYDRNDEHDAGDDCHPGCGFEYLGGLVDRYGRRWRRRGGYRRCCGFVSLTHKKHDAVPTDEVNYVLLR